MYKKIILGTALLFSTTFIENSKFDDLNIENIIEQEKKLDILGKNQKSIAIDFFDFFRYVYSDAYSNVNPYSNDRLNRKNKEDIKKGIKLREKLELIYDEYINNKNISLSDKWGPIIKENYCIPKGTFRKGHEALDIFSNYGAYIFSPFNGLVVASGDFWDGKSKSGKIIDWNNKGLTIRAGNGIIIYNPLDKGYLLISHLQENLLVQTGDIILKGDTIGKLGNTGTAIRKGHGNHIHVAYKLKNEKNNSLSGINFEYKLNEKYSMK